MEIIEKEEEEEEHSTTTIATVAVVNPSSKNTKHRHLSVPLEIIEDILLRLPVESILRSTAVSKPWYSLISHPSFSTLQLTRATTAFFISAYDPSTDKRHYLSASKYGGPLTLLMTVDGAERYNLSPPTHSNGLISFTSETNACNFTPVFINPSTRKIFKLPEMTRPSEREFFGRLYGFDDSTNQHKILFINNMESEFKVFDMSTRSWRQIETEPPVGYTWDNIRGYYVGGVCFDSKVHVMLGYYAQLFEILAFDFVTEKFSIISIPQDAWPHIWKPGEEGTISKRPFIEKISGCLGVVVHDYVRGEIHIWLLQEYEQSVWVKETITLPKPWKRLIGNIPLSIDATMDEEIIFNINSVSENVIIVPVYNRKSKSFRSLEFTLDGQILSSKSVRFHHIKYYVDSMVPV